MNTKSYITDKLIDAVINNDVEIVNELLNEGADPNHFLDSAQVTPLHFAAQNNALEVIPLLVEAGACIDAQTEPDGQTPLDVALINGHERIAQVLMAYLNETDGQLM